MIKINTKNIFGHHMSWFEHESHTRTGLGHPRCGTGFRWLEQLEQIPLPQSRQWWSINVDPNSDLHI